ncbi:hypothetical protein OK016_17775 [Vibrio chagasii]|nr:hypothetical protein [Vibrio chagasii]
MLVHSDQLPASDVLREENIFSIPAIKSIDTGNPSTSSLDPQLMPKKIETETRILTPTIQ